MFLSSSIFRFPFLAALCFTHPVHRTFAVFEIKFSLLHRYTSSNQITKCLEIRDDLTSIDHICCNYWTGPLHCLILPPLSGLQLFCRTLAKMKVKNSCSEVCRKIEGVKLKQRKIIAVVCCKIRLCSCGAFWVCRPVCVAVDLLGC